MLPSNWPSRFAPQRMWLSQWLSTAHYVPHLRAPRHCQLRTSLFTATLLTAVNKDRFGLRTDRLCPPACPPLFPDTAPSSRCRARMSAPMVTNYLCRLHPRFPRHPRQADGVGTLPFRCQPGHRLWRFAMQRNLRLLFRAANAGLLRSLLHSHSAFSAALGIVKRACLCSRWNENSHGCHPSSHDVLSPQATKAASRLPAHRGLSRRHSDAHGYLRLSSATPRYAYVTPKGREYRPSPDDVKGNVVAPTR